MLERILGRILKRKSKLKLKPNERIEKLIQLHTAMMESFDEAHLRRISQTMNCNYDDLRGADRRDKVRELLLWSNRRWLIPKLIDTCCEIQPDFHWKGNPFLFEIDANVAKRTSPEQLATILINYFNLDDLRQLAFYAGIDFEDIAAFHHAFNRPHPHRLSERNKLWIRENMEIDIDSMSPKEIDVFLNKVWIEDFVETCTPTGTGFFKGKTIWLRAVGACHYLHPEAF